MCFWKACVVYPAATWSKAADSEETFSSLRSDRRILCWSHFAHVQLPQLSPVSSFFQVQSPRKVFHCSPWLWTAQVREKVGESFSLSSAAVVYHAENTHRKLLRTQGERKEKDWMQKVPEVIHAKADKDRTGPLPWEQAPKELMPGPYAIHHYKNPEMSPSNSYSLG